MSYAHSTIVRTDDACDPSRARVSHPIALLSAHHVGDNNPARTGGAQTTLAADHLAEFLDRLHFPGWRVGTIDVESPLRRSSENPALWFYLAVAGEVQLSIDSEAAPIVLRRGDSAIIISHSRHDSVGFQRIGDSAAGTKVAFGAFAIGMSGVQQLETLLPRATTFAAREQTGPLRCEGFIDWFAAEVDADRPGAAVVVSRFLQSLIVETLRTFLMTTIEQTKSSTAMSAGPLQAALDPYLSSVLRMVHAMPERAWTVHSMARESGLSRSAFADRFRTLVGQPPLHYVTEVRMQKATKLLETTDVPVKRISALVGYESVSAFSSAFKRRFGSPPVTVRLNAVGAASLAQR